jgi:hypothetical protein
MQQLRKTLQCVFAIGINIIADNRFLPKNYDPLFSEGSLRKFPAFLALLIEDDFELAELFRGNFFNLAAALFGAEVNHLSE